MKVNITLLTMITWAARVSGRPEAGVGGASGVGIEDILSPVVRSGVLSRPGVECKADAFDHANAQPCLIPEVVVVYVHRAGLGGLAKCTTGLAKCTTDGPRPVGTATRHLFRKEESI